LLQEEVPAAWKVGISAIFAICNQWTPRFCVSFRGKSPQIANWPLNIANCKVESLPHFVAFSSAKGDIFREFVSTSAANRQRLQIGH